MDKIEPMNTPKTRAEFEYRFHLLREQINNERYHMASGLDMGLDKVRLLPNGRIDFLSVNESARLQANMTAQFDQKRVQELIDEQDSQKDQDESD